MKTKTKWEEIAFYIQEVYGVYVDWEERFYTCPFCNESIYECDWGAELNNYICPICEEELDDCFNFTDEEDTED